MSTDEQLEEMRQGFLQFANHLPFFRLIGLEVVDVAPGSSKVRINWREDLCQPAMILHGGIVATLIDSGIAHALLLTDAFRNAQDSSLVSVDLRVKYLRPVGEGTIECVSTIPRMGRQIIHGESVVTNAAGKEVARGDSIYMVVKRQQLRESS